MEQRPQQVRDGERGAVDQARTTTSSAAAPSWVSLVHRPTTASARRPPPSVGRVVARFVAANLVGVILVLAASVWASRQAAQDEALRDARHTTDLMATLLVEPNVADTLLTGDPQAIRRLDGVLWDRIATAEVMRVKIWAPDGRIVYRSIA